MTAYESPASFCHRAKEEIYAGKPLRGAHWRAFARALFLFGGRFEAGGFSFVTEHRAVSLCCSEAFKMVAGERLGYTRRLRGARTQYRSACDNAEQVARLSAKLELGADDPLQSDGMEEPAARRAFLSGAFMACCSVTDPAVGYHLSFKPASEAAGDRLFELLTALGYPPKTALYRGEQMLYYKDSEPIEDILTAVGAPGCSLELMETKVYRDLRNRANRLTNAETANIDKTVASASAQLADIVLIYESGQADLLPPELAELADLRLKNPEASLRELGGLLSEPISRSGVNHRMRRLSDRAGALRRKKEEEL